MELLDLMMSYADPASRPSHWRAAIDMADKALVYVNHPRLKSWACPKPTMEVGRSLGDLG